MRAYLQSARWRIHVGSRYLLARVHRLRLASTCFVGITGSAGKTTTKDLSIHILSRAGPSTGTLRTANTPDMISETLLETTPEHRYCVIEMGAFKPGALNHPIQVVKPVIGVLTLIGRDHYSAFKGLDAIATEKGKLIEALPAGGTAVLNIDDPRVRKIGERCRCRVIWVGEATGANLRLISASSSWPDPLSMDIEYQGRVHHIQTSLHGKHLSLSVLCALGVGLAAGIPIDEAIEALQSAAPSEARMQPVETEDGIVFVRDDWKATHWCLEAPFDFMRDARAARKVMILGTLSDSALGPSRLYPRVAKQALEIADLVIFTGNRASYAAKAKDPDAGQRLHAIPDIKEAARYLGGALRPGDLVLLKGTNKSDHLIRLLMDRESPITCWKNDCRWTTFCYRCSRAYKEPHDPVPTHLVPPHRRALLPRLSSRLRNNQTVQALLWKMRVGYLGSSAWLHHKRLSHTKFIGITGSAAKTLTKDLSVHILSSFHQVSGTKGSLNVPIAVSRTVLAAKPTDDFCIVEIGAYKRGAFDRPLKLVKPTIGAVTIIGRDHYRAFKSLEGIAEEKGKLIAALPKNGTAVLNVDDPRVRAMADLCEGQIIRIGRSEDADIRLLDAKSTWPHPLTLTIECNQKKYEVQTQLHGSHLALPVLTALGISLAAGIPLEKSVPTLAHATPTEGRMQIVTSNDGVVFVRDDIKAPAWSLDAPLGFLGEVKGYRRVAVIGTVSDYSGDNSEKYRQFARKALKHADLAIFVGPHAHRAVRAKADPDDKSLLGFKTAREAALYLRRELKKGDMVLLKGSNKVDHLERLFLDRNSPIQCWREQCKKSGFCPACPGFHETTLHQSRSESISESSELASNNPVFSSTHDNSEQARRIVIAGLGNPGSAYDDTPHNVGHHLLDTMANASEGQWETTLEGLTCTVSINGVSACLFKPSANMNVCGPKMLEFLQRVGSDPSHCMIVHDDMDLALGIVRLKRDGGDAGHRGVRSVVTALGTDAILRVRIGVRRPGDTEKAIHRVLARFTEQDREALKDSLERGAAMIMQHLPQPARSG